MDLYEDTQGYILGGKKDALEKNHVSTQMHLKKNMHIKAFEKKQINDSGIGKVENYQLHWVKKPN